MFEDSHYEYYKDSDINWLKDKDKETNSRIDTIERMLNDGKTLKELEEEKKKKELLEQAEWIKEGFMAYVCSHCDEESSNFTPYCPYCGYEMKGPFPPRRGRQLRTQKEDKNGKEIVEGDIVRQTTAPESRYPGTPDMYDGEYTVVYVPVYASFMLESRDGKEHKHHFLESCSYEVIDHVERMDV